MAAAGRVIATVPSTTATTSLLSRGSLRRSQGLSLCFNSSRLVPKKRLFPCTALYKPDVQIKEEGLPETLDYRVFFIDNSAKKVLSLCFNSSRLVPKKRLFTCTDLYKPNVQIKEEGLPETLDYRVFFVDNSGKKAIEEEKVQEE
ncbi:hypothetical protein Vadar_018152 [Vaccinium darrowii]|uniref:Uncharacterized protein n=1 Tax=Vaccinium darrowii TaxID=229202 RepID=A0ACB7YEL6_9ERIC|nr:hypothetical protein Vadar_018152 [Vaccinium darrowii]